jgi:hypothetical protein
VTAAVGLAAALAALAAASFAGPEALRRSNFRGRSVSLWGGFVLVLVLLLGGAVLGAWALVVAVALAGGVGAYDDLLGDPAAKGLAGHLRALLRGRVTSGLVKLVVVGLAGLAAAALLDGVLLLDAVVVAGCANLLNLFDLRPGRALKVALLVTLPLAAWHVAGACAGLLPHDLRERTMLGDTGANALGAAVGVVVASRLSSAWTAVAAAVVVALTLLSERVSFSRVIDAVAPLRWADRLGRAA